MKHSLSRGAALLTALILALSAVPWASARSSAAEPYAQVRSVRGWRQAGEYREGLVRVTDGALWGYADANGGLAIPLRYDAAEEFSLGCALVTQNGKTGLLNRSGAFLLAPEYDELTDMGYGVYLGQAGQCVGSFEYNPHLHRPGAFPPALWPTRPPPPCMRGRCGSWFYGTKPGG